MLSRKTPPLLTLLLLTAAAPALYGTHAHLNYPDWWRPVAESDILHSPPPPRLAEREETFRLRNSPEETAALAKEFFRLVDIKKIRFEAPPLGVDKMGLNEKRKDYSGPRHTRPNLEQLLSEERYLEALDAYRDFFFTRLTAPPPGFSIPAAHPMARQFVEFIHQPDELLDHVARLTMLNDEGKGVVVRLNMGAPGRVNWTWFPHQFQTYDPLIFPQDGTFMTRAVKYPTFYNTLLNAYLESGTASYLHKWSEFMDDRLLNLSRDCEEAGFRGAPEDHMSLTSGLRLIGTLRHVTRQRPALAREFPSPTLARLLIDLWKTVPTNIRMAREVSTNRSIEMYSQPYFELAVSFPEFEASSYLLREKMRIMEASATVTMMPDGSDIENSEGYNTAYLRNTYEVLNTLRDTQWSGVPWATPDWFEELEENLALRMSYLIQRKQNNGWEWYPNYYTNRYASKYGGKRPEFFDLSPKAFLQPRNRSIVAAVWGQGDHTAIPGEPSNAWPYSGQFILRESWHKEAQVLYMDSPRPYNSHTWKNANDIQLFAFGQPLLTLHTEGYGFRRSGYAEDPVFTEWEEGYRRELREKYKNPTMRGLHQWEFTPLFVDGLPQLGHEAFQKQPYDYRAQPGAAYGKMNAMAYPDPIANRWHDSPHFTLAEGTYAGPYASVDGATRLDGVTHRRQVLFVREAKAWIVVDRVAVDDEASHSFTLDWKLAQPFESDKAQIPGFTPEQITSDPETATIRTSNPNAANITIAMHSATPLKVSATSATFSGTGEQFVVTLLYPRRDAGTDLKSIGTLKGDDGATGFTAEMPDGTRLSFAASPRRKPQVSLENLAAEAEALLVVTSPDGTTKGLALSCLRLGEITPQRADFEFTLKTESPSITAPIYRPMERVTIEPASSAFEREVAITLHHPEKEVEIRYTLDGSDPTPSSPLYSGPFTLRDDAVVKATAFRPGLTSPPLTTASTLASVPMRAHYKRSPLRPAIAEERKTLPGLRYGFTPGDWSLGALWSTLPQAHKTGVATSLFDPSHSSEEKPGGASLLDYNGMLHIPEGGLYTFHAPRELVTPTQDAGYDLRLWVNGEEWYPATRWHGFGTWSIPLAKGFHNLRILYVDQRGSTMRHRDDGSHVWRGHAPALELSGPNLPQQPIPPAWFYHEEPR